MSNCNQCNKEYEATGRSLYCSPKCKQAFYRNRMSDSIVTGVTIATDSVTIAKAEPVTITDRIVEGGTCWCCGADINIKLVCCGPCSWSGRATVQRAGAGVPRIGEPMPSYANAVIVDAYEREST